MVYLVVVSSNTLYSLPNPTVSSATPGVGQLLDKWENFPILNHTKVEVVVGVRYCCCCCFGMWYWVVDGLSLWWLSEWPIGRSFFVLCRILFFGCCCWHWGACLGMTRNIVYLSLGRVRDPVFGYMWVDTQAQAQQLCIVFSTAEQCNE